MEGMKMVKWSLVVEGFRSAHPFPRWGALKYPVVNALRGDFSDQVLSHHRDAAIHPCFLLVAASLSYSLPSQCACRLAPLPRVINRFNLPLTSMELS